MIKWCIRPDLSHTVAISRSSYGIVWYSWDSNVGALTLLHTTALVYVIYCYVISEWRSPYWHYFLVHKRSKCKHTTIHQIYIKCIVCNKNNNKLMFSPSVENTFIAFGMYMTRPSDLSDIPMQKQLMCSPKTDWMRFFSCSITHNSIIWYSLIRHWLCV